MASTFSFDIVSDVDLQEVDNALQQTQKEVAQRYDLKDSNSTLDLDRKAKTIAVESGAEFQLQQVVDVLQSRLIKRGISLKTLKFGDVQPGTRGTARQTITLATGIDKENAKKIVALLKENGVKVTAQQQDEQVRVSGKSKDDLQKAIQTIREADLPIDVQFTNYR